MRDNPVRARLKQGLPVAGTMVVEFAAPAMAQILADAGLDFFIVDLEHGPFDWETTERLIQVARLVGIAPFVRVTDGLYHLIARALDVGALGVMVPRVETRAQVEQSIAAMRYPPLGERGAATARANNDHLDAPLWDHLRHYNDNILSIIQIERKAAVDRLDDLLSVPGVDVALVGPTDLTVSLGAPSPLDPAVEAAIEKVIAAARRHGVASGIHTGDPARTKMWGSRGMTMLVAQSEADFVRAGARALAKTLK